MKMEKTKITQAEKLQIKLDKLLETKEKKQATFDKSKQELNAVSKEVDGVKLRLFQILQSGSDDTAFSDWAKRKIGENEKPTNVEKPTAQTPPPHTGQQQQTHAGQNRQPHTAQSQSKPQ
jgi:hypothetical protein